ncbi:MAG: Sua5/YciO/YrdC/YwlC family protein [Candidatus Cloacimonadales bacterium]
MKKLRKINPRQRQALQDKASTILHFTGHLYGIGALALNQPACQKINQLKKRTDKGFILLLPDSSWLEKYQLTYQKKYAKVIQQFWPGNVTLIVNDTQNKFPHISLNGKLAVRVPDNPELREFIRKLGQPMVSSSINISGEPPLHDLKSIKARKWFDFAFLPQQIPCESNSAGPELSTIVDLTGEELKIIRSGRFQLADFTRALAAPKILFVCTANICRSPMAEYIAQQIVQDQNLPYRIASAGFLASAVPISENSFLVLQEQGYAAGEHLSTQLSKELVDDCWLILTMTTEHKRRLREMDANLGDKIYTLSEFTGYQQDIEDPYGLEISFYRQTFAAIEKRVRELFKILAKKRNPIREGV